MSSSAFSFFFYLKSNLQGYFTCLSRNNLRVNIQMVSWYTYGTQSNIWTFAMLKSVELWDISDTPYCI